jgi:mannose-6-phosphate isomerase
VDPEPFRIEPIYVPRIWGSCSLAPLYPEKKNLPEPIGEVWLTGVDCRVATGPFAGRILGEAWREMPLAWRGTHFTEPGDFPILVKFIFPKDKLSIQVHPDDAYAAAHEQAAGGRGKTEMWHAVQAEPGARVLVGTKPGVSKQQFVDAIATGSLENLFIKHDILDGDTFYIPSGTPHTIGPGMILCEVQEYSDLTYRVYDYGRVDAHGKPRELHIEKALEVMNFSSSGTRKVSGLPFDASFGKNMLLAACKYFAAERWTIESSFSSFSHLTHFDLLVVLSGRGTFESDSGVNDYAPGQCWFVPASLGTFKCRATEPTSLIHTYVPSIPQLTKQLFRFGFTEEQVAAVVFE